MEGGERWHSRGLKPYFNDFVVQKRYAYGFDGSILSSIDLADGARKWKGGRSGNGQMLLLADQDVLLITSEEDELVLASAMPDKFTEFAGIPALNGKTWNHPVVVRDILLVRNGRGDGGVQASTRGIADRIATASISTSGSTPVAQ
jgi:outer membrane protein assembly factor BamB